MTLYAKFIAGLLRLWKIFLSETEAILSSLTVQYQAIFNWKELRLRSDCNVLDMYANSKARVSLHIFVNKSAHY